MIYVLCGSILKG